MGKKSNVRTAHYISIISLLLFFLWIIALVCSRATFQPARRVDDLAMIHVLFPHFMIVLIVQSIFCLVVVWKKITNKWLHLLLLFQLSLFLFVTPFIISAFSYEPDSLWHAGVARYIPEILRGVPISLSHYAESYPISFLLTSMVTEITGLDLFTYTLYVYPIFCSSALVLICYVFVSKILNSIVAFTSMLLMLPGFHYLEIHVSPNSYGMLFVLFAMLLVSIKDVRGKTLSLLIVMLLIPTHPISPLIFGVFLLGYYISKVLFQKTKDLFTLVLMFLMGIWWLVWSVFYVIDIYPAVREAFHKIITFDFVPGVKIVQDFTVGEGSFIYPEIYRLTIAIYLTYFFFAMLLLFYKTIDKRYGLAKIPLKECNRGQSAVVFLMSGVLLIGLQLLLVLSIGTHFVLSRAIIYSIMMISIYIGSIFEHMEKTKGRTKLRIIPIVWIILLVSLFPFTSYPKETYNTFPLSEGTGMDFASSHIKFGGKDLSMDACYQLAAYLNLASEQFNKILDFPPNLDTDLIVLRKTQFFKIAMRYDLTYNNNRFTKLYIELQDEIMYNNIYSNPTFEVYVLVKDQY